MKAYTGYHFKRGLCAVSCVALAGLLWQSAVVAEDCTQWNPGTDYLASSQPENPYRDSCGNQGVWHLMQSQTLERDPQNYSLLPKYDNNLGIFNGNPEMYSWSGDKVVSGESGVYFPFVSINHIRLPQQPNAVVHPLRNQFAIIGWQSPVNGTVDITGFVKNSKDGGTTWFIDQGMTNLASGEVIDGAIQDFQQGATTDLNRVDVSKGEFIYFIIDPRSAPTSCVAQVAANPATCDTTRLDISIKLVEDKEPVTHPSCEVVKDGLVACYPLDDDANDYSNYRNDGIIQGKVDFVEGAVGKAIQLDGSSGYIKVPHSSTLNVNHHTIAAWILKNENDIGVVVGKVAPALNETLSLVTTQTGALATNFATEDEINHGIPSKTKMTTDGWHFVVMTYDGTEVKFYIDGELDSQTPRTGTVQTNINDMAIGRHGGLDVMNHENIFNGLIDEVRIYNRALSASEVTTLFNLVEDDPEPPPPGEPGNLSVQKLGNGSGKIRATSPKDTLNCDLACQTTSYQYPAGAKVKLSAKPYNAGVNFVGWGGNCSGTDPIITVTLDTAKACTATFALIPKDQLPAGIYNFLFSTVGTGKGVIKSSLGTINCGDKCEGNYVEGLRLIVTAEPSALSTFVKWSDSCGVKDLTNPRIGVLADNHKTCSAEFTSVTETAANSLTDTLYQDPAVEAQFPRALNEACVNEALWLAATPMAFVDSHLKVVGDWPVQFNGLTWYNQSPVGTCTQSVKVNSDAHGDYVEIRVNLQTAAGATEAAGIIISVEDLSAQTGWGYTPLYLPWVQM